MFNALYDTPAPQSESGGAEYALTANYIALGSGRPGVSRGASTAGCRPRVLSAPRRALPTLSSAVRGAAPGQWRQGLPTANRAPRRPRRSQSSRPQCCRCPKGCRHGGVPPYQQSLDSGRTDVRSVATPRRLSCRRRIGGKRRTRRCRTRVLVLRRGCRLLFGSRHKGPRRPCMRRARAG